MSLPAGTSVTAIAAAGYNGLALTSTGGVLAWGWNWYGQLGDGSTVPDSFRPVLVNLPFGVHATAVAAGRLFSLAVTSTGSVLAWGAGFNGELGNGGTSDISSTPVAVHLPAGVHVTTVSAGDAFGLALTSTGGVLAWGDNAYGELGNGGTSDISSTPVAVNLPAGTHIAAVSAGDTFSLALTAAGSS